MLIKKIPGELKKNILVNIYLNCSKCHVDFFLYLFCFVFFKTRKDTVLALSVEFSRHFVFGCRNQRRALSRYQSEEINTLDISFTRVDSESKP